MQKYWSIQPFLLGLDVVGPLPRNGLLAGDHGASEAGQLSNAWTIRRREKESPKREKRNDSVAGQCSMK